MTAAGLFLLVVGVFIMAISEIADKQSIPADFIATACILTGMLCLFASALILAWRWLP